MAVQHKFVSFAEFKARTDGPGGWEGYLSKTGEIDDGGDLIPAGAYLDTIEQFLTRGFGAESHMWDFSKLVGFPTDAKEDEIGLYVVNQFHGTPDAQLVRQKVQERLAANKGVFQSIGYEPGADPIFIMPDEYAKLIPQYSRKGLEDANLLKAIQFPRIRVLPKVTLYEGSIVSVPMLRSAEVTAVKSQSPLLVDGLEYGDYLLTVVDAVRGLSDRTEKRITLRTKEGRVLSSANVAELSSAADELETLLKRIRSLLASATPKPKEDEQEQEDRGKGLLPDAARRELIRFLMLEAQTNGVPI